MGEYYNWVNVDRKEYICPDDFDFGNKKYESLHREGEFMKALRDLLANEWKGCRIIWMGDECSLPQNVSTEVFEILKLQCDEFKCGGYIFDTVRELYTNISGIYKCTEKTVREEIQFFLDYLENNNYIYNQYGIDPKNPYKDLFIRDGRNYKYTINYTKSVAYSFETTKILYQNGEECTFADPLPILLAYGRAMQPGKWVGDIIGVSDDCPENIRILDCIELDY